MDTKKIILLIDDDHNVLGSINLILRNEYELLTATNSITALNIISRQSVNLIISDINIPDINGDTLIKIIGENNKWKHIPIIIISGYNKPQIILPANIKCFLGKPIKADDLLNAVNGILKPSTRY